ncbi:MAG: flagellar biosynthetic protein FliO [Nitrospirae bacterium]|nr:flagellar biosynthetic protein FliO [Nitrospirota bacterium]
MKRMIFVMMLLSLSLTSYNYSLAKPAGLALLGNISIAVTPDNTKIDLKFDGKPGQEKIQYQDDFVQIEFPQTYTDPPKQWLNVEDEIVKNIFVYQLNPETVRVRLFTYDRALNMRARISLSRVNSGFILSYGRRPEAAGRKPAAASKAVAKNGVKKPKAIPVEIVLPETGRESPLIDEAVSPAVSAIAAVAEKNGGAGNKDANAVASTGQSPAESGTDMTKEEDIPVRHDAVESKPLVVNEQPGFTGSVIKMVASLAIVLSVMFAIVFLVKKYLGRKIGLTGQDQKIKVLTSTYLGPRKSIALVEVAGEKIVVGVTAANITMLTKVGREEDFNDILDQQIKPESTNEKVELQDELWEKA